MVRHRLYTYFEDSANPVHPDMPRVLTERVAKMGDEITVDEANFQRGRSLGSFYSEEDAEAIRNGTYRGSDADNVYTHRSGARLANPAIEAADGEGPQIDDLSVEELADYIKENRLNVQQTIDLAGDDLESIEKVLDAENIATDNEPRQGVVHALENKMKAATA